MTGRNVLPSEVFECSTVGGSLALSFGGYLAGRHQSPWGLEGGKALGMDPCPDSLGPAMTRLVPMSEYV